MIGFLGLVALTLIGESASTGQRILASYRLSAHVAQSAPTIRYTAILRQDIAIIPKVVLSVLRHLVLAALTQIIASGSRHFLI